MSDENNSDGQGAVAPGGEPADQAQRQLVLQKIYLKDLSFESPNSPQVFSGQVGEPQIQFNLKSASRQVGEDAWEVVLTITVDAKGAEERSLFLVEIQQAGIFQVSGYEEEQMRPLLGSYCPGVLYPYAREAVSELVSRGGFPQLLLQPINFDAVYMQSQAEQQAEGSTPAAQEATAGVSGSSTH